MATFTTLDEVKDFKNYKTGTKAALGKLSTSTGAKYLYLHRFKFNDKERPLLLVDFDDALTKAVGNVISDGKCKLDGHDRITFEAKKGAVDVDKVAGLLADLGVSRAVARPDEPAPTASAKPVAEKLNMRYGWTEIRTWGADAAELVERFDGLLGIYKGLPEIKPEARELHERLEAIKARMGELAKTQICNNDEERGKALKAVNALREEVEKLNLDARKPPPKADVKPTADKRASTATKQDPPSDTAQTTTPTQAGASTKADKPAITADAIKSIVRGTPSLGEKDTLDKYVARLERSLPKEYDGITGDHYKAIRLLAEATYFKKSKEDEKPAAKAKEAPTPLTTQQARAIDAAMQAAVDAAGANDMIDNDAQVALGDGITHAIGGSNPTHSRGGGHKGSFNKDVTIQQALSNIGRILQDKTRSSINLHFQSSAWSRYNI